MQVATSSMGRGFDVLSAVADVVADGRPATVSEIATMLGRERSQVSRSLAALDKQGFIIRGPGRGYDLAWSWYATAQELTAHRMHQHGLAVLDDLATTVGEAAFLGVLQGSTTLTVLESLPPATRMIGSWIGRSYPAYCSDAGRATLWDASDDEVRAVFSSTTFRMQGPNTPTSVDDLLERLRADRERGYCIVDQEAEPGLYSVAAPVWDFRQEVVAAVQVVGAYDDLVGRSAECGDACARAAAALSELLGAR